MSAHTDEERPRDEAGAKEKERNGAAKPQGDAPRNPRQPRPYPDMVDDTLDDTFPASDPPAWSGR